MPTNQFHYSQFFLTTGIYGKLFDKHEYPWQVLPEVLDFIYHFKDLDESRQYKQIGEHTYVGKNVVIDQTARIQDAAIIGHNTTLGHASYLRSGVLIGEGVHVGHATEVKHSVIMDNTALAHLNYVGDSIVGSGVNISGGATLANWRFDKQNVQIKNGEEKIQTNMEKLGAIVGDGSFIGVNSVLNPGTVLSKDSLVFPLVSVKGSHLTSGTIK